MNNKELNKAVVIAINDDGKERYVGGKCSITNGSIEIVDSISDAYKCEFDGEIGMFLEWASDKFTRENVRVMGVEYI